MMSYFQHLLSYIGVGAATVVLEIPDRVYRASETVQGCVVVRGGKVAQPLRTLVVELCVTVVEEYDDRTTHSTVPIARVAVDVPAAIAPGAIVTVPFELDLPTDTPGGCEELPPFLRATLDPWHGYRPCDEVALQVEPGRAVAAVQNSLALVGYRLTGVCCALAPVTPSGWERPYLLEYHFCPIAGVPGAPGELVATLRPDPAGLDMYLEINPLERGFACYTGTTYRIAQRYRHLWIAAEDCRAEQLAPVLQRAIVRCPRARRGSDAPLLWPGLNLVAHHPAQQRGYRGHQRSSGLRRAA